MADMEADRSADTDALKISRELDIRRSIEDFYLPRQLVNAIVEAGGLHSQSVETLVGIGFLDIAGYTYLSKFLSPSENPVFLNGLYSAFDWVLRKHGGYLNKIEGDSLMFHYGGPIDPLTRNLNDEDAEKLIARELFFTCVEMQRVCSLFNQVNTNFLNKISDPQTVESIKEAYKILSELRIGYASASFNALFQIRIRIGAALGQVLIGNFGPDGAKQWDVIGMPVIDAKRMESSAPIGGLRVTSELFDVLKKHRITDEYHRRIRREAEAMGSVYMGISDDELFHKAIVYLKDKKNAEFLTYSIQVNPSLPESISSQSRLLLQRGESGAEAILSFIRYYRGNQFVIDQMEELFEKQQVNIRKDSLFHTMLPDKYKTLLYDNDGDSGAVKSAISQKYTLFELLEILGKLQDSVKDKKAPTPEHEEEFIGYDRWIAEVRSSVRKKYELNKGVTHQAYYFFNVIFPLFFSHIKAAILESQERVGEMEEA